MDRKFQIGEIASFFDIPASTLRYWEDKGVLHPGKKCENQYREYTIEDLMTISDVIFYKNLGLQLKEIRGMVCRKNSRTKTTAGNAYKTYEEAVLPYAGSGNAGNAESTIVSGNRY